MSGYLVTGGLGFIGSHLVDSLLKSGHFVRILDDLSSGKRSNVSGPVEITIGDIADSATVARAMEGMDGCFNLAAISSVERSNTQWSGTNAINLGGTITVFEAAARAHGGPIPVVYASSAAVYGDEENIPQVETGATRPMTAYGADKLACELHARVAGLVHGVPTLGLRPFNVYGPRQDPHSPYSGVISQFCQRASMGQPLLIHGDGRQQRDFIYVQDLVKFLCAAMPKAAITAPVVNACSGRATTIHDLAADVIRLTGSSSRIDFGPPRPGDIRRSQGCPAMARQLLGTAALTSLEEGLTELLRWRETHA